MKYSIIGFGAVGKALAQSFARKGVEVAVTSTHPPEAIAAEARAIGPTVTARPLAEAIQADVILLAVPFWAHPDVAKAAQDWRGKIIVDVTNAYGVAPEELGGRPSAAMVADAFPGAKLVKAFNHLAARVLAEDPAAKGGRRVVFLSSDDEAATSTVKDLAERLGFAPVNLGKLGEGGLLVQGRGASWGPLIFQDLVKFG
jgi:predicted dinucleotide-binding enzyme